MVKRKCGTCRHFKDGGIAGSGWCQHPARKDIQHMVLVRKSELACRNSWDQDLWEVGDQPVDMQPSTHIPLPLGGGEPQGAPFVRAEMSVDDEDRAGEMFTDRITSISMPIRSQLRPGRIEPELDEDEDEELASDLQAARSSVREARRRRQEQRHLERKKHQESILQGVDDLLDTRAPAEEPGQPRVRVPAAEGPLTARNEPRERQQPTAERPDSPAPGRRRDDHPSVEFSATPRRFQNPVPATQPAPGGETPKPGRTDQQRNGNATAKIEQGGTEPLPTDEIRVAARQQREQQNGLAGKQPAQTYEQPIRRVQGHPAVVLDPDSRSLPPAVGPRPVRWNTGAGHLGLPGTEADSAPPFEVDPIDLSRDLKTVRRCCATCRDFKQVGDGSTGWCNNPYAFSERRMVQSSEIACRSSLGVWWLPHDDIWLEYADTTHHGRPTPLLDDVVGTVPAGRQGMGPRSS